MDNNNLGLLRVTVLIYLIDTIIKQKIYVRNLKFTMLMSCKENYIILAEY